MRQAFRGRVRALHPPPHLTPHAPHTATPTPPRRRERRAHAHPAGRPPAYGVGVQSLGDEREPERVAGGACPSRYGQARGADRGTCVVWVYDMLKAGEGGKRKGKIKQQRPYSHHAPQPIFQNPNKQITPQEAARIDQALLETQTQNSPSPTTPYTPARDASAAPVVVAATVAQQRPASPLGGAFPLPAPTGPQQQQQQASPPAAAQAGQAGEGASTVEPVPVALETVRALLIVLGPNQSKDSLVARVQRAVANGAGRIAVVRALGVDCC